MIQQMPAMECPPWLEAILQGQDDAAFDLPKLLQDSLYYPACGFNGTPVKYLAGNVFSFVFADYGVTKEQFLANLNGTDPDCGFKGYRCVLQREITRDQVVPAGWRPALVPTDARAVNRLRRSEERSQPFGHWSVWKRDPGVPALHGPEGFSFFYLGGEMSAVYQGLYCRLGIRPKVLAIIQPGAFGGEWERVEHDDAFFKQVVLSNQAGLPDYLLHGGFGHGFYESACWSEYTGERLVQLPERYAGLWKRNHSTQHPLEPLGLEARRTSCR